MASQTSLSLSICRSCLRRTAAMRRAPAAFGAPPSVRPTTATAAAAAGAALLDQSSSSYLTLASRSLFSTSSRMAAAASNNNSKGKPIVLEQPDQFRPPSHPQRLGRRRPTPGPAAYNQGATRDEKEKQKTRSYPRTFPNQGTFMHWFLTNRAIHLWITMVRTMRWRWRLRSGAKRRCDSRLEDGDDQIQRNIY